MKIGQWAKEWWADGPCWLRGHRWDNVGTFTDERLHGCTHYALPGCKCARCGARWEIGSRGVPAKPANANAVHHP